MKRLENGKWELGNRKRELNNKIKHLERGGRKNNPAQPFDALKKKLSKQQIPRWAKQNSNDIRFKCDSKKQLSINIIEQSNAKPKRYSKT